MIVWEGTSLQVVDYKCTWLIFKEIRLGKDIGGSCSLCSERRVYTRECTGNRLQAVLIDLDRREVGRGHGKV